MTDRLGALLESRVRSCCFVDSIKIGATLAQQDPLRTGIIANTNHRIQS